MNFLSSLLRRSAPPSHSHTTIAPLAPRTLGASLGPTFLYDVPASLVCPILAFNYAIWRFRKPALASLPIKGAVWVVSRLVELAIGFFSCVKPKIKRKAAPVARFEDPSNDKHFMAHSSVLSIVDPNTAVCYTDGSASPNPGPCGAAASIFFCNPDAVFDAGLSAGFGSNNIAELCALFICFSELIRIFRGRHFLKAIIFCDSRYALNLATSSKTPGSNKELVSSLRAVFSSALSLFKVELIWVRGHSFIGGNERVDLLSKRFAAKNSVNSPPFSLASLGRYVHVLVPWAFGFPLSSVPPPLFSSHFLPFPPPTPAPPVAVDAAPLPLKRCSAVLVSDVLDHTALSLRLSKPIREGVRRSARVSANATLVINCASDSGLLAIPSLPPFAARKRKAVVIPGVNHAMRLTNRSAAVSPALVESLDSSPVAPDNSYSDCLDFKHND